MRLKRYWTFRQRKSTKAFTLRVDWSSSICCTMGQPIPLPCCSYERHNAAELVDGPPPLRHHHSPRSARPRDKCRL